MTDGTGTKRESGFATLKKKVDFAITKDPEDCTIALNETTNFTVEATGEGLTYQWQWRADETDSWHNTSLTGYNTPNLAFVVPYTAYFGRQYRCVVTDGTGTVLESGYATLLNSGIIIDEVKYKKLTDTTVEVVGYIGTASEITIPETIESMSVTYTVTKIGEEAFMNNTNLISIDLPDTITIIAARAFKGCTSLSNMN